MCSQPDSLCLCPLTAKGPAKKKQSRVHFLLSSLGEMKEWMEKEGRRKMQELGHSVCQRLKRVLLWISDMLRGRGYCAHSLCALCFAKLHRCC